MSDPIKPVTPVTPATSITNPQAPKQPVAPTTPVVANHSIEQAVTQLASVRSKWLVHSGKDKANPHIYIERYVKPLEERLATGENSKELIDRVMELDPDNRCLVDALKIKPIRIPPRKDLQQPRGN